MSLKDELKALIDRGLTFGETVRVFAEMQDDRDKRIGQLADDDWCKDGELEFDDVPIISEGDDNGAYVMAWVWQSFFGTELDKEKAHGQEA